MRAAAGHCCCLNDVHERTWRGVGRALRSSPRRTVPFFSWKHELSQQFVLLPPWRTQIRGLILMVGSSLPIHCGTSLSFSSREGSSTFFHRRLAFILGPIHVDQKTQKSSERGTVTPCLKHGRVTTVYQANMTTDRWRALFDFFPTKAVTQWVMACVPWFKNTIIIIM